MSSICRRLVSKAALRQYLTSNVRCASASANKVTFGDPVEHATGLEKREILATLKGSDDPFNTRVFQKGPGTKNQPTEIPSAYPARIVGCHCDEEATSISWFWLHQNEPKRCECGHWYKLVQVAPV